MMNGTIGDPNDDCLNLIRIREERKDFIDDHWNLLIDRKERCSLKHQNYGKSVPGETQMMTAGTCKETKNGTREDPNDDYWNLLRDSEEMFSLKYQNYGRSVPGKYRMRKLESAKRLKVPYDDCWNVLRDCDKRFSLRRQNYVLTKTSELLKIGTREDPNDDCWNLLRDCEERFSTKTSEIRKIGSKENPNDDCWNLLSDSEVWFSLKHQKYGRSVPGRTQMMILEPAKRLEDPNDDYWNLLRDSEEMFSLKHQKYGRSLPRKYQMRKLEPAKRLWGKVFTKTSELSSMEDRYQGSHKSELLEPAKRLWGKVITKTSELWEDLNVDCWKLLRNCEERFSQIHQNYGTSVPGKTQLMTAGTCKETVRKGFSLKHQNYERLVPDIRTIEDRYQGDPNDDCWNLPRGGTRKDPYDDCWNVLRDCDKRFSLRRQNYVLTKTSELWKIGTRGNPNGECLNLLRNCKERSPLKHQNCGISEPGWTRMMILEPVKRLTIEDRSQGEPNDDCWNLPRGCEERFSLRHQNYGISVPWKNQMMTAGTFKETVRKGRYQRNPNDDLWNLLRDCDERFSLRHKNYGRSVFTKISELWMFCTREDPNDDCWKLLRDCECFTETSEIWNIGTRRVSNDDCWNLLNDCEERFSLKPHNYGISVPGKTQMMSAGTCRETVRKDIRTLQDRYQKDPNEYYWNLLRVCEKRFSLRHQNYGRSLPGKTQMMAAGTYKETVFTKTSELWKIDTRGDPNDDRVFTKTSELWKIGSREDPIDDYWNLLRDCEVYTKTSELWEIGTREDPNDDYWNLLRVCEKRFSLRHQNSGRSVPGKTQMTTAGTCKETVRKGFTKTSELWKIGTKGDPNDDCWNLLRDCDEKFPLRYKNYGRSIEAKESKDGGTSPPVQRHDQAIFPPTKQPKIPQNKPATCRRRQTEVTSFYKSYMERLLQQQEYKPRRLYKPREQLHGISQMTRIITTQYYWKGISKSIENVFRLCHTCQIIKRPKGKPYGALGQIPPPQQPFDLISIDTIAGFSKYGHSKTYLHVIVDHLTRYAWTFPSKSTRTLTYIQTLKTVLQQGFPKRLLSDRAPAFTSEKFRKFLITHGIQPLLTTSNNPQANGLIERLNATITGKLRLAYLENPKASWTQLVKRVTQTYNNTPHSVTGFPPTYLMFNVIPPDLRTHLNPYL
ncbi:hypothetical protein LAZ67_5002256 [Cordylochernes scorpioides]|uniref:RNA-directed DNA polymerase n=1 Tax=Cordylochernes scorpioides TaxID=51811 RepID=A0ABY6KGZ2_9ARAC|nr:hypothetical protein LAZ67_5002256 [Cordylochernes scorpioides]